MNCIHRGNKICALCSCDLTIPATREHIVHTSIVRIEDAERCTSAPYIDLCEVFTMNNDTISGQWKQIGGQIKKQWGKLTDNDLKVIEGNAEMLAGRLQERYGIARDEAERQVRDFEKEVHISRHDTEPRPH